MRGKRPPRRRPSGWVLSGRAAGGSGNRRRQTCSPESARPAIEWRSTRAADPTVGLAAIDDPKLVDSELKPPFYSYRSIKIRGLARGPSIGAEPGHGVIRPFAAHGQIDRVEY